MVVVRKKVATWENWRTGILGEQSKNFYKYNVPTKYKEGLYSYIDLYIGV